MHMISVHRALARQIHHVGCMAALAKLRSSTRLDTIDREGSAAAFGPSYSGRAVDAPFPFLISALSKQYGLGPCIGIFAAAAYGVLIMAALALPETRGCEQDVAGECCNATKNTKAIKKHLRYSGEAVYPLFPILVLVEPS